MKAKAIVKICLCALLAVVLTVGLVGGILALKSGGMESISALRLFSFNVEYYDDAELYTAGGGTVAGDVAELDIHWTDGAVNVTVGNGTDIVLRESGAGNGEELRWLLQNGRLTVRDRKSGVHRSSVERTLEVELPARLLRELKIDSASADVFLTGVAVGTLELDTASGLLEAMHCTFDAVDIDCASTDCRFEDCKLGRFEMDTASGNATLRGSVERVELETTSGDLEIVSSSVPYSIEVESTSADVSLTLPVNAAFDAKLKSVSGDLNVEGFIGTYGSNHFTTFPAGTAFDAKIVDTSGDMKNEGFVGTDGSGMAEYRFDSVSGDVWIAAAE